MESASGRRPVEAPAGPGPMSTFDILLLVADLRTTPDVTCALDIASKLVDGANPIELAAPDGPVTIAIRNDVIPRLIDWLSADDNAVDLPTKLQAATLLNRIATMSATQIAADDCVRVVHLLDTVMSAMQRAELAPSTADTEDRAERQRPSNRDQIATGDIQTCRNELIVQLVQCLSRSVSQSTAFPIRMETQPACFDALFEVVATTGSDLSTAAMELAMLFISSEPSPKAPLIVSSRSTSALAIIADKHPSMAVPVITILNRLGDSIEQILHDDASPCIRAVLHSLASLHHFALLSSSVDYIGIVAQLSFFAPNVAIPRATTLHTTEAALAVATLDRISSFARPGQISISELWPLTALFYYADVPASATVTVYRVLQRFIELVDARDADPSSHAFQNALLSLARSSSSSSSTSIPGKVALLHIWTLTPLPSTAALATGADFVVEELRDGATSPGYVDAVARVAGRLGAALAAAQHVKALVRVAFDEERSRDVRLVAARVLQGVAGASPNVLIDSAFLDAVMDTDWAPFDNRHDPEWRSVTLGVAGSVVRAAGPEANLPNGPRLTAVLLSSLAKAANVAVMRVVDALLDSSVYLAAVSAPTGPFYSQQAVLGVLVQIGKRTDDDGISLGVAIADRLIRDDVTLEDLIAGPNGVRVIAEICRICSKVAVGDRIARPAASSLTMSALVHRALVFADRVGKVQDVVDGDDNVMMTAFYGALIENVTRLARKAALAPVDATHWATVISQTAALWVLSKATTVRPDADIAGMIRVALSLSGGGRTDLPAIASALIADIKDGGLIADSRDLLATITQVLPDASVADDDSLVLLCIGLGRMAVSSATRMAMIRTRTVPVLIRLLNPQQREGDARRPAHHRAISDLMRVLNPVQGELAHATDQVATRAWYARTGLLSMSTRKSGFLVGPPHAEPVDAMTSVGHCRDLLTRSGNASATALDRRDDDCRLSMQDWIDAEYDLLLEEGRPPPP